ncbi:hypothetical protein A2U01_0088467, partial [Trifolium medium]|nr:hypothetical protein [Trifolium medium]
HPLAKQWHGHVILMVAAVEFLEKQSETPPKLLLTKWEQCCVGQVRQ